MPIVVRGNTDDPNAEAREYLSAISDMGSAGASFWDSYAKTRGVGQRQQAIDAEVEQGKQQITQNAGRLALARDQLAAEQERVAREQRLEEQDRAAFRDYAGSQLEQHRPERSEYVTLPTNDEIAFQALSDGIAKMSPRAGMLALADFKEEKKDAAAREAANEVMSGLADTIRLSAANDPTAGPFVERYNAIGEMLKQAGDPRLPASDRGRLVDNALSSYKGLQAEHQKQIEKADEEAEAIAVIDEMYGQAKWGSREREVLRKLKSRFTTGDISAKVALRSISAMQFDEVPYNHPKYGTLWINPETALRMDRDQRASDLADRRFEETKRHNLESEKPGQPRSYDVTARTREIFEASQVNDKEPITRDQARVQAQQELEQERSGPSPLVSPSRPWLNTLSAEKRAEYDKLPDEAKAKVDEHMKAKGGG